MPAVAGNLWIRAERVSWQRRFLRIIVQIFGRQYSFRREPLLYPMFERRHHVEWAKRLPGALTFLFGEWRELPEPNH